MASQDGHTSVLDVLLRHGADPHLANRVSILYFYVLYILISASTGFKGLLNKPFSSICAGFHLGVDRIHPGANLLIAISQHNIFGW